MILLGDRAIVPTIFPDKTSQVWKIDENILKDSRLVEWYYESEDELIHLCQLLTLLKETNKDYNGMKLFIPYLPYARQDKQVGNSVTFALWTTMNILTRFIKVEQIVVFDVHNWLYEHKNLQPTPLIQKILNDDRYNAVVYPDESAMKRYHPLVNFPRFITMKKKRDQLTGKIIGHEIDLGNCTANVLKEHKYLVLDDLIDGGATFYSVAKTFKEYNTTLDLYISHGIFSNGYEEIVKHYRNVFTTDSYINKGTGSSLPEQIKVLKIKDYYHI